MPWFVTKLLGHTGMKKPYVCTVFYANQPEPGTLALWAEDLRDAIQQVHDLLPEHIPGVKVVVQLRVES